MLSLVLLHHLLVGSNMTCCHDKEDTGRLWQTCFSEWRDCDELNSVWMFMSVCVCVCVCVCA